MTEKEIKALEYHARALACFCSCVGMVAENAVRERHNCSLAYDDKAFSEVMQSWGLIDPDLNPIKQ